MIRLARVPTAIGTVATVAAVRLLLWTLPYARARALLGRPSGLAPAPRGSAPVPDAVAARVARAARVIPGATCLVQALAAEWLLARAGYRTTVRFGVARRGAGIEAHAWLEYDGRVLLGGEESPRFAMLRPPGR